MPVWPANTRIVTQVIISVVLPLALLAIQIIARRIFLR